MHKITAIATGLLLGCAASAFAAQGADTGTTQQDGSGHRFTTELKGAFHRVGAATRHLLRRADGSLHPAGHHGNGASSS